VSLLRWPAIATVALSPSSVTGGAGNLTGLVTLSAPAVFPGEVVTFSSNTAFAKVNGVCQGANGYQCQPYCSQSDINGNCIAWYQPLAAGSACTQGAECCGGTCATAVTVPAGATTATFAVTTFSASAVTAATITASNASGSSATGTTTVNPWLALVSVN